MTNIAPIAPAGGDIIEQVITKGDLSKLTPPERVQYYKSVCESIGLNPLTRPFEYLQLSGRLVLYARRDAADQLRKLNNISLSIVSQKIDGDLITVHVRAETRDGRTDEDFGAVNIAGLKGEARANATLKAITKAKRRVTLSIAGLGFLDETEVDDIEPRQPPGPPPSVAAELDTFAAGERLSLGVPDEPAAQDETLPDDVRLGLEQAAMRGVQALRAHARTLDTRTRAMLSADHINELRRVANEADEAAEAEAQREADPFGLLPVEPPPFVDTPELDLGVLPQSDVPQLLAALAPQAREAGDDNETGDDWARFADEAVALIERATQADINAVSLSKMQRMQKMRRESGDDYRRVQRAITARVEALGSKPPC